MRFMTKMEYERWLIKCEAHDKDGNFLGRFDNPMNIPKDAILTILKPEQWEEPTTGYKPYAPENVTGEKLPTSYIR